MPASSTRVLDALLDRLLTPRIGPCQPGSSRRIHDFVQRAAVAREQDGEVLLKQMLAGDAPELLDALINSATIGHTAFFRHPAQFEHLRVWLPSLALARRKSLSLWCAGCSTGEEAYSLALCAEEVGVRVSILATDVNPIALQAAREGHYVATHRLRLPGDAAEWTAPPLLRKLVRFERASITGPDPTLGAGRFDLVFLRNVLIYFDRSTVAGLLARLSSHILPGGALVVSPADAVLPLPDCLWRGTVPGWLELPKARHDASEAGPAPPQARTVQRLPAPVGALPIQPESHIERAARLLGSGARDEAERVLANLLNQDPDDLVAWFLLGEALLQRGERVQARLAFHRASRAPPREVDGIDGQAISWAAKLRVQAINGQEP